MDGKKAKFTGKCKCENPKWVRDDIEVNQNTKEVTYKMTCGFCKAFWGSKSHEYRKYWNDIMDEVPVIWCGYSYKGKLTVNELFKHFDEEREEYLKKELEFANKKVAEAKKEAEQARKKLEKFRKEIIK